MTKVGYWITLFFVINAIEEIIMSWGVFFFKKNILELKLTVFKRMFCFFKWWSFWWKANNFLFNHLEVFVSRIIIQYYCRKTSQDINKSSNRLTIVILLKLHNVLAKSVTKLNNRIFLFEKPSSWLYQ